MPNCTKASHSKGSISSNLNHYHSKALLVVVKRRLYWFIFSLVDCFLKPKQRILHVPKSLLHFLEIHRYFWHHHAYSVLNSLERFFFYLILQILQNLIDWVNLIMDDYYFLLADIFLLIHELHFRVLHAATVPWGSTKVLVVRFGLWSRLNSVRLC